MTAEVAILNKQAVAMAADSAVTIGDLKIFNTVNKLFALSRHEPVGIMVYSSAEIMGVPVEIVVKEFRKTLGDEVISTLSGYTDRFEEFLRDDRSVFTDENRIDSIGNSVSLVFSSIAELAGATLSTQLATQPGWGHPTREEAESAIVDAISKHESYVLGQPEIDDHTDNKIKKAVEGAVEVDLEQGIQWLANSYPLTDDLENRVRKLVLDQLFRKTMLGGETGIVIAGYGEDEVFPSLRSMEFQCSGLGLHNCPHQASIDIGNRPPFKAAQIIPFAQSDVMSLFVEGRDRQFDEMVAMFLDGFLSKRLSNFVPGSDVATELENLRSLLISELLEEINNFAQNNFIHRTMEIVEAMPKEEIAILAEALVNLTGLKRKASSDKETVGGPTDVAVLSKGDGFVWISRKHYFDPTLNPGFASRYMRTP